MNSQVHSLIYDLRRRMCVAVAETVSRRSKPAAG
jgi:hypothetical protein